MEGLQNLHALLSRQLETQKKLLELEESKTLVLKKGTPEQLDEIINKEQPLIMLAQSLEKRRETLQRKLGLEKRGLKQIVGECDLCDKTDMKDVCLQLEETISKLKKINNLNSRLIQSRIETNKGMLKIFGMDDGALTYSKQPFRNEREG